MRREQMQLQPVESTQEPATGTRSVTLTVRLPNELADEAEQLAASSPEFLSCVVLYGLTRRMIYQRLHEMDLNAWGAVRG